MKLGFFSHASRLASAFHTGAVRPVCTDSQRSLVGRTVYFLAQTPHPGRARLLLPAHHRTALKQNRVVEVVGELGKEELEIGRAPRFFRENQYSQVRRRIERAERKILQRKASGIDVRSEEREIEALRKDLTFAQEKKLLIYIRPRPTNPTGLLQIETIFENRHYYVQVGKLMASDRTHAIHFFSQSRVQESLVGSTLLCRGESFPVIRFDSDIVFARQLSMDTGLEYKWFVGRKIRRAGQNLWRPLSRNETKDEFLRRLNPLSEISNYPPRPFRDLPRPQKIIVQRPKPKTWGTARYLPESSAKDPAMMEYPCQIDGGHTFRLLLPKEGGEKSWAVDEVIALLKEVPALQLSGIDELIIAPSALIRSRGRRCLLRGEKTGQFTRSIVIKNGISEPKKTIAHEILGHGIEVENEEIERLIVLAMKLDKQLVDDVAMKNPQEYFARAMERYVFYPEEREFYGYTFRLIDHLLTVDPRKITPEGRQGVRP